jgi:hypothetical protein
MIQGISVRVRCKKGAQRNGKEAECERSAPGLRLATAFALFRGQALRDLNRPGMAEGILIRRGLCSLANREVLAQNRQQ